ncbi:hypothetical protein ANO14919_125500 [Xylariales sp. No.14919]|nr:hypothetical protein ANO14919_125500 [Xylariales sp. No.14919]
MYLIPAVAALLLSAAMAAPTVTTTDLQRTYFTCDSSKGSGFSPSCCTDINGQVGINSHDGSRTTRQAKHDSHAITGIGAHISGVTNPMYNCNLFVYNITGCCQTTGYKNPYTNNTLDLCAMNIDPI